MKLLSATEAQTRLSERYGIDTALSAGDVDAASEELRERGPFVESVEFDNLPDALLDWISLRAYQLASDDEPPVEREGVKGTSVTYATPARSQTERRLAGLIRPYQRVRGYVR